MNTDNQFSLLNEACKLLGWQGGTIHQVKDAIGKLEPMQRGILLNQLKKVADTDEKLFRLYCSEYAPLRIAHIEFKTF